MITPSQTLIRNRAIEADLTEMNLITQKPRMTREDRTRFDFLSVRVSALKAGYSPEDLAIDQLNRAEHRAGDPLTRIERSPYSPELIAEARAWQQFIKTGLVEKRVGEVGQPILSYEKQGSFVPFQFFQTLYMALKQHDPLFDPECVTYVETPRGGTMHAPIGSDLGNVAEPVVESADDSGNAVDLSSTDHKESRPKAYRSPLWYASIEAEQDLNAFIPAIDLWAYLAGDRIARGVGKDLINGSGINGHILGLLAQLTAAGDVPTIASGSASNTGGSETGTNSIGTKDLAKLYFSVDQAYRKSPKAAWLMNDNTLEYLVALLDKQGRPIVNVDRGYPTIHSKPVLISPSLDDIGGSKTPILFGDFRYWLTHCAKGAGYIVRYTNAPGLVEKGIVGFRAFVRFDGQLLWNDATNSKSPIRQLQNAS